MKLLLGTTSILAGLLAWMGITLLTIHVFEPQTWRDGFSWPWVAIWISSLALLAGSVGGTVWNWGHSPKVDAGRKSLTIILAITIAVTVVLGYFGYRHENGLANAKGLAPIRLQTALGLAIVAQIIVSIDLTRLGRRLRDSSVPVAPDKLSGGSLAIALAPVGFAIVLGVYVGGLAGFFYLTIVAITSLWAIRLYTVDKATAAASSNTEPRSTEWQGRIAEKQLHIVEALGGWPGAFIAQRVLRHKNAKGSFQKTFALMVLVHVAALALITWIGWGWQR